MSLYGISDYDDDDEDDEKGDNFDDSVYVAQSDLLVEIASTEFRRACLLSWLLWTMPTTQWAIWWFWLRWWCGDDDDYCAIDIDSTKSGCDDSGACVPSRLTTNWIIGTIQMGVPCIWIVLYQLQLT